MGPVLPVEPLILDLLAIDRNLGNCDIDMWMSEQKNHVCGVKGNRTVVACTV